MTVARIQSAAFIRCVHARLHSSGASALCVTSCVRYLLLVSAAQRPRVLGLLLYESAPLCGPTTPCDVCEPGVSHWFVVVRINEMELLGFACTSLYFLQRSCVCLCFVSALI